MKTYKNNQKHRGHPFSGGWAPPQSKIARMISQSTRTAAPPTLPAITMTDVSDDEMGLPVDPLAQDYAERAIRAAVAYRIKQDMQSARPIRVEAVEVPLDDDALAIRDVPEDILDGITHELRRLAARPRRDG